MDRMTELQQAVTVGAAVLATILTRFLPYILLPAGKETPAFVRYLGMEADAVTFTHHRLETFAESENTESKMILVPLDALGTEIV